jgi:D-amino peptidase
VLHQYRDDSASIALRQRQPFRWRFTDNDMGSMKMKVYIMTDMEGVAGVINCKDWCEWDSRYYGIGKELLTKETNAAIEGFFAGGATEVVVADGHGSGGIDGLLLDPRVELIRGFPGPYPFLLDSSSQFIAWIGQHAKACTEYAHLAHTNSFACIDQTINGISVGEFGEMVMCASELGVRSIFLAGDEAACKEAQALVPGIETASVKRGTTPGRGEDLTVERYGARNEAAIHRHPERARERIRQGAERAIRRASSEPFGILPLRPPFWRTSVLRPDARNSKRIGRSSHPSSVIALMNLPMTWESCP